MNERRASARYRGLRRIGVQGFDDATVHDGYLMDLSDGGAGIALHGTDTDERYIRMILGPTHADWHAMEVVERRKTDGGTWLHAQFCDIDQIVDGSVTKAMEDWIDKWGT